MKTLIYTTTLLLLLTACQNESEQQAATSPTFKELKSPCEQGGEPNLFTSEAGQVYLSWVEYMDDTTDVLQFSTLENDQWSKPQTIASGSNWFVNWADFPSLVAYQDDGQSLAAHWLQTSAEGTFDYDVRIAQSFDAGKTWTPSFIPHRDSIHAEHGFVSMLPLSENKIFATWLDGRNTKGEDHDNTDDHGHEHHGAMSLRAATFDKNGRLQDEVELDNKVCDCCGTSAAMTDQGLIVAYRDRSEDEIRDISIIRQVGGEWTDSKPVFEDNWHIAGCPVNGASIKADGKNVAIVWFSSPDNDAQVKVAFSEDSGKTFSSPIRIDKGKPLGRVDLVLLSKTEALVSWIEQTEENAEIRAVKVNIQAKMGDDFLVATSSSSRQSGFPVMTKANDQIIFAWTDVDSLTRVKTMTIKM